MLLNTGPFKYNGAHVFYTKNVKKHKLHKIEELLKLGILSNEVVLAGGSLQTLINDDITINDYDIFFVSDNPNRMNENVTIVSKKLEDQGYECVFECPAGELRTFKKDGMKIQLIKKSPYIDMESLISSFDFTACMAAYNGTEFLFAYSFIKASKYLKLDVNYISYPVSSLRRLLKYQKKGFYATNACLRSLVEHVHTIRLSETNMSYYFD